MKQKLTKVEFLKDVAIEIKNLKKYATKEEINRLDINVLRSDSVTKCIYGQMTGGCLSDRASRLIFNSCKRFVKWNDDNYNFTLSKINSFNKTRNYINGRTIKDVNNLNDFKKYARPRLKYISSLETYISFKDAKNKNVIDYLQGKVKKLVL